MSEIMFLNPSRRGHAKRKRSRRHSFKAKSPKRRVKRRRGGRRGGVVVVANPHRRRGKSRRGGLSIMRNPVGGVKTALMDAAYGAGGAVAMDLAMGFLPLPTSLQSGPLNYAAKGAIAIGLGMAAEKFLGSARGSKIADGALTVVMYEAAKAGIAEFAPTVAAKMGALEVTAPARRPAYYTPGKVVGRVGGPTGTPVIARGGMGALQMRRAGPGPVRPVMTIDRALAARVPGA